MKVNVGGTDRLIRAIIGIVLLALGIFSFAGVWQWIGIIVGAILVLTAIFSFCPLYSLIKVNTAKKQASEETAATS
ncbi:MAG: DUF2892 domain-containing protein [Calditrichaeota bacterium]|nr:MAG: DUF2892 domain-containing protein [Calditrichota bacterium]